MLSNPRTQRDRVSGHDAVLPICLERCLRAGNGGSQICTYLGLLLKRLGLKCHPMTRTCPATAAIAERPVPRPGACPRLAEEVPTAWATLPREGWSEQRSVPGPPRGLSGSLGRGRVFRAPGGPEGHPCWAHSRVPMTRALCLGMGPGLIAHPDAWHRTEALTALHSLELRGPGRVSLPLCTSVSHLCSGAGQGRAVAGGHVRREPSTGRGSGPGAPSRHRAWRVPGARSSSCDVRSDVVVLSRVMTSGRHEVAVDTGDVRGALCGCPVSPSGGGAGSGEGPGVRPRGAWLWRAPCAPSPPLLTRSPPAVSQPWVPSLGPASTLHCGLGAGAGDLGPGTGTRQWGGPDPTELSQSGDERLSLPGPQCPHL